MIFVTPRKTHPLLKQVRVQRRSKTMHKIYLPFLSLLLCSWSLSAQIQPKSIQIVRDFFGVPHIFAKTDAEVAYGLAWAHCEDDFETVQTCFLASKGLLGRVMGKDGAAIDFVVQLIRARALVDSLYSKQISPEYNRLLEGYAAGFNAFARAHPREVRHKALIPITPRDMAVYGVLQLFVFTGGDGAIQSILGNKVPMAAMPKADGSNAYAFNSRKTKDGQTYLAINSHQPWEGIVAWYEAHLCSEEGLNIIGALFPGAPHILSGVNEYLGWAHTVNNPDKLDIYELEINPNNRLQYRFDGKWLPLEERRIKLRLKVAGIPIAVHKKAWYSVHGPVLKNKKGMFAIRSTGMFDIRALEEWFRMNKARNFTEFYAALNMGAIPGFNVVYADRYDTIFYLSNAKLPVRNAGFDWKHTLPGNTSRALWTEFQPIKNLPQILNPKSGYLFNSNNTPFNASAAADNIPQSRIDPTMGYELWENNRSERFMELIAPLDKIDYQDFKRIKYDQQLPAKLSYAVQFDSLFGLDSKKYPEAAPVLDIVKAWNRRSEITNTSATVFMVMAKYVVIKYKIPDIYTFKKLTVPEIIDAAEYTRKYMMRQFGRMDVPLGDYQKLVRGKLELPLSGAPDNIAAIYSMDYKKGKVKGVVGDCYIELVRFTPEGPVIESVNVYGASSRPGSPHYADQAPLFVSFKTKPMTLKRSEVFAKAERVYHPE
jgi:acyl-homoserine-lactone acylase